jgi:F-type H+-transporting ATPase subunit gamma
LEGSGLEKELPMLKVAQDIKNVAIVVVCSDKGLCGGFNAFVWKRVLARVQALNEAGITPKILSVGKKSSKYCTQKLDGFGAKYEKVKEILLDKGGAEKANEVGEEAKNLFLSGEVDKVEIIYSKFVNLLTSTPTVRTLLPLTPQGIEDPEDETFRITSEDGKLKAIKEKKDKTKAKEIENDVLFDQSPEVILNSMLPLYVNSLILAIIFDSTASELAARMTAMKAATDNAGEVSKKLTRLYNRKRQAAITAELCDIVGGCTALEDDGDDDTPEVFEEPEELTEEFEAFMESGELPETELDEVSQFEQGIIEPSVLVGRAAERSVKISEGVDPVGFR